MTDWQEANANNDDMWDLKDPLEGRYVSKKVGVGANSSMVYTIALPTHNVGVWGSTVLDSKFQEVPIGSEVRVEFLGMNKGKSGKEYKDFKLLFRPAPFAEAGAPQSSVPSASVSSPTDAPPIENYEGMDI